MFGDLIAASGAIASAERAIVIESYSYRYASGLSDPALHWIWGSAPLWDLHGVQLFSLTARQSLHMPSAGADPSTYDGALARPHWSMRSNAFELSASR